MTSVAQPRPHLHWQPLERLLEPRRDAGPGLPGFDPEFGDIVDYIIKITHRIWEEKNVGLCRDYYSAICPVHTLGGCTETVEDVVQGTLRTMAAFPDRILIGENVVWSADAPGRYYSSHRITSAMTNSGWSEFGAPTGRTVKVTTIADCVCEQNRIVYEWLVRDNGYLVRQLGYDPREVASRIAATPASPGFRAWWEQEFRRARESAGLAGTARAGDPAALPGRWVDGLLNGRRFGDVADLYRPNARVEWPGGRHVLGPRAIAGLLIQWLAQIPDARAVCDHVAVTPFDADTVDVAFRWTLAGTFATRDAALQSLAGQPALVLAATHLRVTDGRIAEEWTVFDEIALLANLVRRRDEPPHD